MQKSTILFACLLFVILCSARADTLLQKQSDATKAEDIAMAYNKSGDGVDGDTLYKLGLSYYEGEGVDKDYRKAGELFYKAAETGDTQAMYKLYGMYYSGEGVVKDYTKAVKWVRKAAEAGNSEAMTSLGLRYYYGEGITKDYKKAAEWYSKAAEAENSRAMYLLGLMYDKGEGVAKDHEQAIEWYNKCIELHHNDSEMGNSDAMYKLGNIYFYGDGVTEDTNEAIMWYKKAAEAGHTEAMYDLADIYFYGWGVTEDTNEAVEWYIKSAEVGNADAMYELGDMYSYGWGITDDFEKADEWYSKAMKSYRRDAKAGDSAAMHKLASMYENGEGTPKDYKKAIEWYNEASKLGNTEAMYRIGLMYENGKGVDKDYEQAKAWYKKAIKLGNNEANARLVVIFVKKYYKVALWAFLAVLMVGGVVYATKEKLTDEDTKIFEIDSASKEWIIWTTVRRYVGALLVYLIYWLTVWGSITRVVGATLSPDKAKEKVEIGAIESVWDYGWGDHYVWFLISFCFVTFCCAALAGATAKKKGAIVASIANLPVIIFMLLACWFFYIAAVDVDVESPIAWKIILPLSIVGSFYFAVVGGLVGQRVQNTDFEDNTIFGIRSFHWAWLWIISSFYIIGLASALIPIIKWSWDDSFGPGIFQILYLLIYGYPMYLMYQILSGEMLAHKNVFVRIISFIGIYLGGIAAAVLFDLIRFGLFKLISYIF